MSVAEANDLRVSISLPASYARCEQIARREAGNFYHGFRVLPRPQRLAMCALYAFMRIADDLSDDAGAIEEKTARLADWRQRLHRAMAGEYTHSIHAGLHDTVYRYAIPVQYLDDVIDGVEMDLVHSTYATFSDLRLYCYRVASAVGLACIHVWGFTSPEALGYAENAGLAFQLTNILRDLAEDAARGRVYLPQEDLQRFGYTEEKLSRKVQDESFHRLMRFEVDRARGLYEAAWPLVPLLSPAGRAIFLTMAGTYRGLLEAIEKRHYDVFSERVRLSNWRKLMLTMQALPARWGYI